MKKRLEHDVRDAFMINPASRTNTDLKLMLDYCQLHFEEFKTISLTTFQHLNQACRAKANLKAGQVIDPNKAVISIIYCGDVTSLGHPVDQHKQL